MQNFTVTNVKLADSQATQVLLQLSGGRVVWRRNTFIKKQ